jgi:hypothetical protein
MIFRLDVPEYGFSLGDGSNAPSEQQKHSGQFRDIVLWTSASTSPRQLGIGETFG